MVDAHLSVRLIIRNPTLLVRFIGNEMMHYYNIYKVVDFFCDRTYGCTRLLSAILPTIHLRNNIVVINSHAFGKYTIIPINPYNNNKLIIEYSRYVFLKKGPLCVKLGQTYLISRYIKGFCAFQKEFVQNFFFIFSFFPALWTIVQIIGFTLSYFVCKCVNSGFSIDSFHVKIGTFNLLSFFRSLFIYLLLKVCDRMMQFEYTRDLSLVMIWSNQIYMRI